MSHAACVMNLSCTWYSSIWYITTMKSWYINKACDMLYYRPAFLGSREFPKKLWSKCPNSFPDWLTVELIEILKLKVVNLIGNGLKVLLKSIFAKVLRKDTRYEWLKVLVGWRQKYTHVAIHIFLHFVRQAVYHVGSLSCNPLELRTSW